MEANEGRFCIECGYQFTEDYGFCPRCGCTYRSAPSTGGREDPREEQRRQYQQAYIDNLKAMQEQIMESNRSFTLFMLIIWVIMSGILAAMSFLLSEDIVQQYSGYAGLGKEALFEGAVLAASCAAAAVSAVTVSRKRMFNIALYSCVVSTVVTGFLFWVGDATAFYFLICGFLCCLRIRGIKPMFTD